MLSTLTNPSMIKFTGTAGSLLVVLACLIAAFRYTGKSGERFSPFNHFISELGERGVSAWAILFNTSMIIAGLLLLPCCIGLGLLMPGGWAKAGMLAGCAAAAAVAFVGIFPMNDLSRHIVAAMTFFRAGLVMVILFSVAIWLQPEGSIVLPKTVNLAGSLAGLAYASFLLLSGRKGDETGEILDPGVTPRRPTYWILPIVEWVVFLTTILWFFTVAVAL